MKYLKITYCFTFFFISSCQRTMDIDDAKEVYESYKLKIAEFEMKLKNNLHKSDLFIVHGQDNCCGDIPLDSSLSLIDARSKRLKEFEERLAFNLTENGWISFYTFKYEVNNDKLNPTNPKLNNWIDREYITSENWNYIFDEDRYIYWGEVIDELNNKVRGIQIKGQVIDQDSLLIYKTVDINYNLIILVEK